MKCKKAFGFSLIELIVAMGVFATIAAVAYPTYQSTVRKTRRSDAKIALSQAAGLQERWHTENSSYTNSADNLGGSGGTLTSPEGYYAITVTNPSCSTVIGGVTYYSCYTLTATPVGHQAGDTTCATLSLDQLGKKTSTGGGDCW